MKALAEFAIALSDFTRAEGRRLADAARRHALTLALVAVAAGLGFLGLAAVMFALYLALAVVMPLPLAVLFTGLTTLLLAGGLLWLTGLRNP